MKKAFRFSIFLLFAVLMLLVPLRKSQKEVVQPIVEEDSLRVIATYKKDTQIVIINTVEGKDTSLTISTSLQKDTVLIQKAKETPVVVSNEKAAIDFRGFANLLLILLFWLCFWGGIAYLVYRIVMARWQQKYWVQYSADAPILGFVEGQLNIAQKEIVMDFKGLEIKPEIKALPNSDVVVNLPEIEGKNELETVTEIPQTVENSTPKKDATSFLKNVFQKIIQLFSKTGKSIASVWNYLQKNISKEKEVIEKESIVESKTVEIEKEKPIVEVVETATKNQDTSPIFTPQKIARTSLEVFKLPFHIVIEAMKGIRAILTYFTKKKSDTSSPVEIDFKWQDVVSIIFEIVLFSFKQSKFYSQNISFETSVKQIIIVLVIAWLVPSLVRKHWGWVVVIVFAILTMLIILLIAMAMEAGTGTSEPMDFTGLYILLAVTVLGVLYWKFKHKIPAIQLPKIKFSTFSNTTKELLFARIVLFIVVGGVFFYPYFEMGFAAAFAEKGGWGDVFSRAVIGIIVYEICAYFALQIIRKREVDLLSKKYDAFLGKKKNATQKTVPKTTPNKPSQQEAYVDLKTLMQQKKWWKKAELDKLEEIIMTNKNLDQNSEFVVDYLPECVNAISLLLDQNKFIEFPLEILDLEQLEILKLSKNQLSEIPSDIEFLENLTTLYLSHNQLSDIPDELANLKNLRYLDLTNNPLTEEAVQKIEKLFSHITYHIDKKSKREELRKKASKKASEKVSENTPEDDANLIAKVSKLFEKELRTPKNVFYTAVLMEQGLSDLPLSVLQKFPNLAGLMLHSNQFKSIPYAVYHLPLLKVLNLPFNKLKEIPDNIVHLQQVEELDFSGNPLTSISDKLAELPKLRVLGLANLGLEEFPEILLKIKTLEKLSLSSNKIFVIPEEIQQLEKLEELNFDFIGLEVIPNSILGLKNLKVLNWAGNQLTTLPKGLTKLKKLEKLSIGYNRELLLSEEILGTLPNLKFLFIAGIDLGKRQPKFDFTVIKQLKELWMGYNGLTAIPDSIFEIEQLYSLSLTGNKITEIPAKIDLLTSLTYLYLDKNAIKKLPDNFKMLKKLRHLDLTGNPIDDDEKERIKRMLPGVVVVF